MPIGRSKFQKSTPGDPMNMTLNFLQSHSRYAYAIGEIEGELALRGIDLAPEEMQRILSFLEALGRIESKRIGDETYYNYCKIIGTRPF